MQSMPILEDGDGAAALRVLEAERFHTRALARAVGRAPTGGNHVSVLLDGPQTYAAMFDAIDRAHEHINIESYTIEADGPGEELARRLVARRRDGVAVNLLFDSFGSLGTPARYFDNLRQAGVRLCEYNPLGRLSTLLGSALHLRDHRKLMLIDGRVGFIGGVNISGVYAVGSAGIGAARSIRRSGWRDTHVRVEGPVVAGLQRLFVRHWRRFADEPLSSAHYFPPLPVCGEHRVAVAAAEAGSRHSTFYRALLAAIETARDRILLTGAYFVPTRRLLRALARAAARQVDVRIVLPGISDCWAPLYAGRSHYGMLLRAGVRIFERHDTLLHAKTCVIDGVWATVGSSNYDWRSFLHNAEANIVVLDAGFGRHIERVFANDVAHAREVDLADWLRRGRLPRLKEWLARRVEFFL